MKTVAAKFLKRYGFRRVMIVNGACGVLSLAAIGFFTPATPYAVMLIVLLIGGCFRSLQFTSLNAISYADVDNNRLSQATSIASVAQQLSVGMGVVLGGFALQMSNRLQGHATLVSQDFWPAFLTVAVAASFSIPMLMRLPPDAGAELAGRDPKASRASAT
jgi:MFS family permease